MCEGLKEAILPPWLVGCAMKYIHMSVLRACRGQLYVLKTLRVAEFEHFKRCRASWYIEHRAYCKLLLLLLY